MANFQQLLFTTLVLTIGCTLAHPVVEERKSAEISPVVQTKPIVIKSKLRQEGDGDGGDGGDGDGAETPEFAQVGAQVGQIITGALGGNIGGVFGGATSFIQEEDTKSGVGNILSSIAKPFNQLLISGVMSGQKFFGITNPPAILISATTLATPAAGVGPDPTNAAAQAQPAAVQQVKTTIAPVPLAPKDNGDDDDDELRALIESSKL